MIPGEVITKSKDIEINKGRKTVTIETINRGDRPIQVGSHFHFFEINKLISFDRKKAFGMRLDIPSGTSVRFEPGEIKTVTLVQIGGNKKIFGLNNLTSGNVGEENLEASLEKAKKSGFLEV